LLFDINKTPYLRTILFPILVVVLVSLQTAYGAEHEVTRVHDGDTIRVKGDYGELTIRLVGIDAPEKSKKKREPGQPFSQKAKEYLADLVLKRSVDVKEYGVDRYGRILGIFVLEGSDVNLHMIRIGFAEVYRGKPAKGFDPVPYIAAQREAMERQNGMWVQGMEYVSPRDWRRGQKRDRTNSISLTKEDE
jgi:endonuclease YncB( thermonuclease family)